MKACSQDKLFAIRTVFKNPQDIKLILELSNLVKDMSLEDFSAARTEFKTHFIDKDKGELIKINCGHNGIFDEQKLIVYLIQSGFISKKENINSKKC